MPAAALPAPAGVDVDSNDRPYRLGAYDKIKVEILGPEPFSSEIQVDGTGVVALPMISSVAAVGKTPVELARDIAAELKINLVREPKVAVYLVEPVSQTIAVDGEVEEPGIFPVLGRMSLTRAIAMAKGATELSSLEEVVVFREVDGQRMAALYSLKGIREGRYADPELFAGDSVVVGQSRARRVFKDIGSVGGLLTAPLVAIVR